MIGPRFVVHWRVEGTCGEVADILGDVSAFPRWWPAVVLRADDVAPPGPGGVGRRVRVEARGWLPYTWRGECLVTASNYPFGLTLSITGDLAGRVVCTFTQSGPCVDVTCDWRADEAQLPQRLRPLVGALLAANGRWVVKQGEASLALELARRRATGKATRAAVPPPSGPVTYAGVALVAGAALIGGTLAAMLVRSRRHAVHARRHRS